MKNFLRSRDGASKGAALLIALALVVLLAGLALAYFTRTTSDRQLAQTSYNDTSSDLLARSALDIVVGDFKQEILAHPTVTPGPPFYIQPTRYGDASIPNLIRRSYNGDPTNRTSTVSSGAVSANGRSISTARWNSHYLLPRLNAGTTNVDSTPIGSFIAPDWVLVTPQGPASAPTPTDVIGRYAFAVYDEGGLLDMTMAGYPGWSGQSGTCDPAPTPWLVNVGRKGTIGFADLTALPTPPVTAMLQSQVDNIVGWRNYAMTQRTPPTSFGNFSYTADNDCAKQNWYGSYLMYFGDPPFSIESLSDKLLASIYPFTSVANYMYPTPGAGISSRTDQSLMTRQQLLKLRNSLNFSQDALQYMGTFSRERNWPAPDWPNLNGTLSEGRFNLNNLALVIPNPGDCNPQKGKKKGWQTGKNQNHLCGTPNEIIELFGLFWKKADSIDPNLTIPGHWKYIDHTGPNPPGDPDPNPHSIICFRGANQQEDFFQILHYALNVARPSGADRCAGRGQLPRTFAIGASLIDQYDTGAGCPSSGTNNRVQPPGCDLDARVVGNNWSSQKNATHTTAIEYGQGAGSSSFAFGMEPDYSTTVGSDGYVNGDCAAAQTGGGCSQAPHRPCVAGTNCAPNEVPAPTPGPTTQVISHAFSTIGEFGYGIDTSTAGVPTMDFSPPTFYDAPVLDFFSYNPISSAYPRAGIVNLYTKNAPVIAAMLSQTLQTDAAGRAVPNPTPVVSQSQAMAAANAIVTETQNVLAGGGSWPVTRTDMTRAIAARLAEKGGTAAGLSSNEQKESIARALAEMGQTRTWNLFIDVIAQTGKYSPNATNVNQANKFIVEGEKRYWLHIALGRDLIQANGSPCGTDAGAPCQVDVLGSQLEEVVE